MQINRLFETIYLLLNKNTITAKELADHFGVSQRTIYRDIDMLSFSGIPVYTEKGKGGGISLLPGFVLNKSLLSDHEQMEILSALHGLASVRVQETGPILEKLSTLFHKNTVNWIDIDFSGWNYTAGNTFQDFKTAILEQRITEFDYYSTYGEKIRRRMEPIQLLFKSRAWYIKGYCLTRQDIRLFKLSRVKSITVTEEYFSPRNLSSIPADSELEEHRKKEVSLHLKISPKMTYRVYDDFEEEQISKAEDGSHLVSVTWPEDEWVYGFLLSFGEYIEVLEPEHIRNIIKQRAQKVAEKYSQ